MIRNLDTKVWWPSNQNPGNTKLHLRCVGFNLSLTKVEIVWKKGRSQLDSCTWIVTDQLIGEKDNFQVLDSKIIRPPFLTPTGAFLYDKFNENLSCSQTCRLPMIYHYAGTDWKHSILLVFLSLEQLRSSCDCFEHSSIFSILLFSGCLCHSLLEFPCSFSAG